MVSMGSTVLWARSKSTIPRLALIPTVRRLPISSPLPNFDRLIDIHFLWKPALGDHSLSKRLLILFAKVAQIIDLILFSGLG